MVVGKLNDKERALSLIEVLASLTILTLIFIFVLYLTVLNTKAVIRNRATLRKLITAQNRLEYLIYNRDKLTLSSDAVLYSLLYSKEVKPGSSADAIYSFYYNYVKGLSLYFPKDFLKGLRIATRIALYDSSPDLYVVTVYVYERDLSDAASLTRVIHSTYGKP